MVISDHFRTQLTLKTKNMHNKTICKPPHSLFFFSVFVFEIVFLLKGSSILHITM